VLALFGSAAGYMRLLQPYDQRFGASKVFVRGLYEKDIGS
jgi:hypothetical protein